MDSMGPGPATRLEPRRSEDRQPPEHQQQRRESTAARQNVVAGKIEDDRAQVAAAEPEAHQLDERA